ncbi:MAG: Mpo1-like protein [Prochlorococcaceae cyanobacterium]|jgi:uncharacterized membrane protein YGL010W
MLGGNRDGTDGGKNGGNASWIERYGESHRHPVNQACHLLGIPLIVLSLALAAATPFVRPLGWPALGLFVFGWALQFLGHAVEGRPPEFLQDPRFLLVGVRWWWRKVGSYSSRARPSA